MVREIPQSAMAVSAGHEALVLDQSRMSVLCAGVVLTKQHAIIRVSRNQQPGNKNGLGYLTIIKIDLCRLALTDLLFKLGLTIRYIGTLVHIAALRSDLSFFMR